MKTKKEIKAQLERLQTSTAVATNCNQHYIEMLEWVLEVEN